MYLCSEIELVQFEKEYQLTTLKRKFANERKGGHKMPRYLDVKNTSVLPANDSIAANQSLSPIMSSTPIINKKTEIRKIGKINLFKVY